MKIFNLFLCLMLSATTIFAFDVTETFSIKKQELTDGYQQYVGKRFIVRPAYGFLETWKNTGFTYKESYKEKHFTITKVSVKDVSLKGKPNIEITVFAIEDDGKQKIKFKGYEKDMKVTEVLDVWGDVNAHPMIHRMPIIFTEPYEEFVQKHMGEIVTRENDNDQYEIVKIFIGEDGGGAHTMVTAKNKRTGETMNKAYIWVKRVFNDVLNETDKTSLKNLEKPEEAQINIIEDTPKPTSKPFIVEYDSLTNIEQLVDDSISYHKSYNHLIGQTIRYVEPDTTKYKVYHTRFYDTPKIAYKTPNLPQSICVNRSWIITNIVNYKPNAYVEREIIELTDAADGMKAYCEPLHMNRDFVVLGFYEKIKKQYVGKTFVYQKRYFSDFHDNDRYNYLISLQTKEYNKDIPENTLWKCVDIAAYNITKHNDLGFDETDKRCPVILIFENDSLGKYYSYVQNKISAPFNNKFDDTKYCRWYSEQGHEEERLPLYLGKFLDEGQYAYIQKREKEEKRFFAAQDQKKKQRMIAKYGKYMGKLIAEGEIQIGMTKQMCRDSWGEPEDINQTTTRYGTHEQWIYTSNYVYFDNGKISAIQDR